MFNTEKSALLKPDHEAQRLQKLYSYQILGTPPDESFEKIAHLAAQLFDTTIAQITFVDQHSVFFKSNVGVAQATEMPRENSLCALAILNDEVTVFESEVELPKSTKYLIAGTDREIKFYAGAPLKTIEGFRLGTICVMDSEPKQATPKQLLMLQTLAGIVMDELTLGLTMRKAMRAQTDFMNRVVHDLKNPNTTISLSADLIKKKSDDPKIVDSFANRIKKAANGVLDSLNNLLNISQIENGNFRLNREEINVLTLLESVKESYEKLAAQKKQVIYLNCRANITVSADPTRLEEAMNQLLSNALIYSPTNSAIHINVSQEDKDLIIEFKDHGQGLTEVEIPKLFTKFAQLSSVPTGKEHQNGLGLSIVKMLMELHHGKVWAESEGKNKGASFFISLPTS